MAYGWIDSDPLTLTLEHAHGIGGGEGGGGDGGGMVAEVRRSEMVTRMLPPAVRLWATAMFTGLKNESVAAVVHRASPAGF